MYILHQIKSHMNTYRLYPWCGRSKMYALSKYYLGEMVSNAGLQLLWRRVLMESAVIHQQAMWLGTTFERLCI